VKLIKIYTAFLLFLACLCQAQSKAEDFLVAFGKAGNTEKLRLTARLPMGQLKEIYPRIQDTLRLLKYQAYHHHPNSEAKVLIDAIEANLELSNKNFARTIFITENCLQNHALNINDSLVCYSIQKSAFIGIRNFFKAYEINTRMETLWPRKSDSAEISFGVKKSNLYASLGFIKEAIEERRKEFYERGAPQDTDQMYTYYSDLGIYFNRLKLSDSASAFFLKALDLLEHRKTAPDRKVHYDFLKGVTRGNLGLSYFNAGEPEKAIPLIKEDIYYSRRIKNYQSLFLGHKVIAECYLRTGELNTAKRHIDSATAVLENFLPDGVMRQHLYFVLSRFFEAKGEYRSANSLLNRYFDFRDSLTLIEKEQNLRNAEIAFKIEQKEQELKEKNKILEQKALDEAREKTFRAYSLAGIIILLVAIVFLVLINYFSKKREKELYVKNEQIRQQNLQIEQSLGEKEVLIKEIHHRVKNNLQIITSMLSLQISREEGRESEAILREAKQRISSIALTHQMLYQNPNLSDILVNEYIENLVRQIEHSIPPANIELITELAPNAEKINIDHAVPLGLLINELLTNSFKHAFPENKKGVIRVSLQETENNCVIGIVDNGVGLPEDFNFTENKSMGMELIHILSEQLDARLRIERKNGAGFILEIPKNKLFA
jgi:two-component sensor histidine kinase